MADLELNKIVGMIMENPELVEKIKAMGEAAKSDTDTKPDNESQDIPTLNQQVFAPHRSKRNELLRAMQSFLSDERKKSLETMMTIADVLDAVKKK